jgi:hypothetical protein
MMQVGHSVAIFFLSEAVGVTTADGDSHVGVCHGQYLKEKFLDGIEWRAHRGHHGGG